jgi:serine/threonine-protein kinase
VFEADGRTAIATRVTPPPVGSAPRNPAVFVAVAGVLLLGAVTAIGLSRIYSRAPAEPSLAAQGADATRAEPLTSPERAPEVTPEGPPSAAPIASGASITGAVVTGAAAVIQPPVIAAPKPRATPATAIPSARPTAPNPKPAGCDPPYTIDGNGHKRYKRECLH